MKVGFNTNVPYKGKLYHVQTEDCGLKNPVVLTLLYQNGAILASKKTSYEAFLGSPERDAKIQELMKLQHKVMMKELISGKYFNTEAAQGEIEISPPALFSDIAATEETNPVERETGPGKSATKEAAGSEKSSGADRGKAEEKPAKEAAGIKDSLDDILLDFIMKKHKQE